jgi:U3 small nucleolar RNA-associated protein 19
LGLSKHQCDNKINTILQLLDAELGKDVKKAPVIEFQIPRRIFLPQDEPAVTPDSLLVKLWDFGTMA